MLHALANAASNDELTTPDEDATARHALEAFGHGEALSPNELKGDLDIA